jgi:hypothetical protein
MSGLKAVSVIFCALSMCGCCSFIKNDAILTYRKAHSKESAFYTNISQINIELLEFVAGTGSSNVTLLLNDMKQRFQSNADVAKYVNERVMMDTQRRGGEVKYFQELRSAIVSGGIVCQFEWKSNGRREIGLLTIQSGRITRRDVWLASD